MFVRLTRPFVALLNGTGNAILRRCGYGPAGGEANAHSVDELDLLIEDTREAGVLSDRQAEFARKVFRLSGRRVADCMVPRERMAALPLDTPPDRVLERVRSGAHTRMPVYDGDPDNVVGVVNTKDLFHLFSIKGLVILEDAVYPPLFLKPDDAVADALELFRRERRPRSSATTPGGCSGSSRWKTCWSRSSGRSRTSTTARPRGCNSGGRRPAGGRESAAGVTGRGEGDPARGGRPDGEHPNAGVFGFRPVASPPGLTRQPDPTLRTDARRDRQDPLRPKPLTVSRTVLRGGRLGGRRRPAKVPGRGPGRHRSQRINTTRYHFPFFGEYFPVSSSASTSTTPFSVALLTTLPAT